ncbi:axin-2-like [Gouania willdenowi]|uniref:Axin 2 n=1 Tax=Gouania willdenowi TaxID=441366 RepID=A0A8C5NE37_GOUWI|nr:axin-2 [Gouania willdenowi]XP_028324225.1 axin-2 [Gouania willdenowi]XP_028324306.1 axin-2 [Gouania willdenowi]XP_028324392.1 axin-2 [Gouania willdenowi]XP_028324477.1 axin-2 [Gouania willdenowi]XP_028324565.1 axin-2 [Gouania willdenowi]XP_028324651.1 axin-2 [Gouania willdenowi]
MSRALTELITSSSSSFREDAPRPPVPGEEGDASSCCRSGKMSRQIKGSKVKDAPAPPGPTPRRNEGGLGEPEGSASPDSPLVRWTKSLHFLLGDRDGAHLFKTFLERENCVDTLDFWFACNGFRQMDLKDTKTMRVAKVIFKRYVENNGIVAKHLKPATKTFIRDSIKKQLIDSAMFDQAQTEIQSDMEDNAYQMFLTSDIYLEYVRAGCENAYLNHGGGLGGSLKLMCGYLPPLMEEEEWTTCSELKARTLGSVVGLSAKNLRATATIRTAAEVLGNSYRSQRHADPASPYFVNSGYIFAPATSANDSEMSSDATTDDSMSMTDSSVDGIPPYKLGKKKQIQREMHRSVKINGQVTLPHFPRTHRLPKEMTPVEPSAFAAQLITRLERLKREQDTMSSLEERLQQIQEEEEREESGESLHHPLLPPGGQCEEDPQAILDEHLSRVLKTPGCQSPGVARHSPRSRSPEQTAVALVSPGPTLGSYPGVAKALMAGRPSTKHIHHHYIHHHHAGPRTKEQMEAEAAQRVQCLCPPGGANYSDFTSTRCSTLSRRPTKASDDTLFSSHLPLVSTDRSQNVWQWILESERQGKHKPDSIQSLKKPNPLDAKTLPGRTPWGGGGIGNGVHPRGHHPGHPFIQDPAMPPLPPPNTLAQLEEACRRLEEVSKPPKQQRHSLASSSLQRDRSHPAAAFPAGCGSLASSGLQTDESRELMVTYFFCGEEIPYRSVMKTHCLTLGHFKEQLSKKGNYRYYFKKASDEFECGAVFEEVCEDAAVLPTYDGKVLGKVERMD